MTSHILLVAPLKVPKNFSIWRASKRQSLRLQIAQIVCNGVEPPPESETQRYASMKPYLQIQRLNQVLQQRSHLPLSPSNLLQLHSQLITSGLHSDPPNLLSLLELYLSNPSTLSQGTTVFHQIKDPCCNLKWRLLIVGLTSFSKLVKALSFFKELQALRNCSAPFDDPFVYASVFKACHKLGAFREGKSVHCNVIRLGLDCNVYVVNSIVRFYSSSLSLVNYASLVFDRFPDKNVVTLNCMISGRVERGQFDVGLGLFVEMLKASFGPRVEPNHVTLEILASSCAETGRFGVGKSLHAYCCKVGLDLNTYVCNVLIDFYAKCSRVQDAERIFRNVPDKDIFSWNTMISGYAKNKESRKALLLFKEMKNGNIGVDRVTIINLLRAAANTRDLIVGRAIHANVLVGGIEFSILIGNALISLYSKCGKGELARRIFDNLPEKDIVSWNSMIHGYVECLLANEAIKIFDEMQSRDLKADDVTLLGMILACRDSYQLNRGIQLHSFVEANACLNESIHLQNALLDMYAKCGSMIQARALFEKMPCKDLISWTTMIIGHAVNNEHAESLATFHRMLPEKIDPDSVAFIGVLSACNHAGLVSDGKRIYNMMINDYHIEPGIEHCGCMVDMLARSGKIEEAYVIVRSMPAEPSAFIWRTLISACRVHGHFDLALDVLTYPRELNVHCSPEDHALYAKTCADIISG